MIEETRRGCEVALAMNLREIARTLTSAAARLDDAKGAHLEIALAEVGTAERSSRYAAGKLRRMIAACAAVQRGTAASFGEAMAAEVRVEFDRIAREIARDEAADADARTLREIADALGTGETGAGLVEVARNAHAAEYREAARELREDAAR